MKISRPIHFPTTSIFPCHNPCISSHVSKSPANVPSASILPSLRTTILSACRKAIGRCDTTRYVPVGKLFEVDSRRSNTLLHNFCSVSTSRALERSSNTNSSDSRTNIRAAAVRCSCPPESLTPLGPITVSNPLSNVLRSSSSAAAQIAAGRLTLEYVMPFFVHNKLSALSRVSRPVRKPT